MSDFRVICDISMGGTHPDALLALGAPDNVEVRYYDGLHAKVYLSDRGVVIGSANASANGVGFESDDAKLIEAGTYHAPGSDTWKSAANWFDVLHLDALQVDETALERARRLFRSKRAPRSPHAIRSGSLLDMVVADPGRFDGVGFILCSTSASADERAVARQTAINAGIETEIVENTSDGDMFVGWAEEDVLRWPVTFIELWMPRKRLHLYARTLKAIDPTAGNVFTRKNKRALKCLISGKLPDFSEAEHHDAMIVAKLLNDGAKVFRTASDFAEAIGNLPS